jgi:hypothetical protein
MSDVLLLLAISARYQNESRLVKGVLGSRPNETVILSSHPLKKTILGPQMK